MRATLTSTTHIAAVLVALSTAISGCGADDNLQQGADPLINGETDVLTHFRSVVRLHIGGYLCSGTVVGERLVLTARHCLTGPLPTGVVEVIVGSDIVRSRHRIIDWRYPSWVQEPTADVALLLVDGPLGVPAMRLPYSTERQEPGTMLTLVGFGAYTYSDDLDQKRRYASAEVTVTLPKSFNSYLDTRGELIFGGNDPSTPHFGGGDSGGAVLRNDKLVGIIRASTAGSYVNAWHFSYADSVHIYRNWIDQAAAEMVTERGCGSSFIDFSIPFNFSLPRLDPALQLVSRPVDVIQVVVQQTLKGDFNGDGCEDELVWTAGSSTTSPERIVVTRGCDAGTKRYNVSGVLSLSQRAAVGRAGQAVILFGKSSAAGDIAVLDDARENLSKWFEIPGPDLKVRGFFETNGTGQPELVVTTKSTGVHIIDLDAGTLRSYSHITYASASDPFPRIRNDYGFAGTADLDGQPGVELILHKSGELYVVSDRKKELSRHIIPAPSTYSIAGQADLDGQPGSEVYIAQPGKIVVFSWSNSTMREYAFDSSGSSIYLINGAYDTDGQAGDEIVVARPDGLVIIDHAERRIRKVSLATPYRILGSRDEIGGQEPELHVMSNGTEYMIQDLPSGTTKTRVVPLLPLHRLYNPTTGDHFYTTSPRALQPISGYQYERVEACMYAELRDGRASLKRFFKAATGDHYYSDKENPPAGYQREQDEGFVEYNHGYDDHVPLQAWFNPTTGDHFYAAKQDPAPQIPGYQHLGRVGWVLPAERCSHGLVLNATLAAPQRLAVFRSGIHFVDKNGDGKFVSGGDNWIKFGSPGDRPLAGRIGRAATLGIDAVGVYRKGQLYLDDNGQTGWQSGSDTMVSTGGPTDGWPFVGDFDHDGIEELGIFDPNDCNGGCRVQIDFGHDLRFGGPLDVSFRFGASGDRPIVQRRAGQHDLFAVYRPSNHYYYIDTNGDFDWSSGDQQIGPLGSAGDVPVAFDVDHNGVEELGVYRPGNGAFYFDSNGQPAWQSTDKSYAFNVPDGLPLTVRGYQYGNSGTPPAPPVPIVDVLDGYLDKIQSSGANRYLAGWACFTHYSGPVDVKLYIGGPAGTGFYATRMTTYGGAEAAIHTRCSTPTSVKHRFLLPLDPYLQVHAGKKLYVYGVAPDGTTKLIGQSGVFAVPPPPAGGGYGSWSTISGLLHQISAASDGSVWGVNASNSVYRRSGSSWTKMPGVLKQISVGSAGDIWGVNPSNSIYRWNGSGWTNVGGALAQISVGSDATVWGVNTGNNVYRRNGNSWSKVPGVLKQVAVGNANNIWGINPSNSVYRWNGNGWTKMPGVLESISVGGDGDVWGVNSSHHVYRWNGSGWSRISTDLGLVQVSTGSATAVWGVTTKNQIWQHSAAAVAAGPITGFLDKIEQSGGSYYLAGWACYKRYAAEIAVTLYLGAPSNQGGVYATTLTTYGGAEDGVYQLCQTPSHVKHRFRIPLDGYLANYPGKKLYVYGMAPSGSAGSNQLLNKSGDFQVPGHVAGNLDTIEVVDGKRYLAGWACYTGHAAAIQVQLYVGAPKSQGGTYLTSLTTYGGAENAVYSICKTPTSVKHRFRMALEPYVAAHQGKKIYVYGIAPSGTLGGDDLIGSSGAYSIPGPDPLLQLHRLHNASVGDHFYTKSSSALGTVAGYTYERVEGCVYQNSASGRLALRRYYNSTTNDHLYQTSTTTPSGYVYEQNEGYVYTSSATGGHAMFHYYSATLGDSFYLVADARPSTDPSGYTYKGIVGYLRPRAECGGKDWGKP